VRIDERRRQRRVLIYSHDSFGLGHLRRCRTIAHSLVETDKDLSVLILSGSPIIGSFDFRARVDFIRVPGVIKLRNGEYTSLNLHLHIEETLRLYPPIPILAREAMDDEVIEGQKVPKNSLLMVVPCPRTFVTALTATPRPLRKRSSSRSADRTSA